LITTPTVFKWRQRYLEAGIEVLSDLPRSGQSLKLGAEKAKEVLTLTTHRVPKEVTHWSVRLMAKHARVTTWQIRQIWAAFDLKQYRLKTFNISNDPHFAEKVIDVVGLYLSPPDNAFALGFLSDARSPRIFVRYAYSSNMNRLLMKMSLTLLLLVRIPVPSRGSRRI